MFDSQRMKEGIRLSVELQNVQCIFVVLLQSEREREREIKMYNDF